MNVYLDAPLGITGYLGHDNLSKDGETPDAYIEKLWQQGDRMSNNLRIFANDKLMSRHALNVVRLQGFVDTVRDASQSPEIRQAAAWRTMEHLTSPELAADSGDIDYMFALWRDFPEIDTSASNYRDRLANFGTDRSLEVLDKLDGVAEITEDDWHDIRIGVDVPKIVELSQQVNVESILARSVLVLDRVATATTYDSKVLEDILAIETVYAPLLDLLGLHASEAMMRHHTEKARLIAGGREDARQKYDEISDYIESVRSSGLANDVIANVIGVDLEHNDFNFIIDNEETVYGSKSYFSAIRYESAGGIPARFISRIKSPGSCADKTLHHYNGEQPQDIYAGTVVTRDINDMVAVFHEVYNNIEALSGEDTCEFVSAPSKDFPVHVKGKEIYREAVAHGLGEKFDGKIDFGKVDETIEEPFQVLKVTFNIRNNDMVLPVEIQFQTIEDRNRSRLGGASHLGFKADNGSDLPGNTPGDSVDLWNVNNRKWAMLEGGEDIHYDMDHEMRAQQIQQIRALQQLFMTVSFETEKIEYAA